MLCILAIISLVIVVLCISISNATTKEKERKKKIETAKKVYTIKGNRVYLNDIHPDFSTFFTFEECVDAVSYHTNPQEIHFGAVSVGGYVSGGTYKTGGNTVIDRTYKSKYGFAKILNPETNRYVEVHAVVVSDEIIKQARESGIKEFVSPNENVIYLSKKFMNNNTDTSDDVRTGANMVFFNNNKYYFKMAEIEDILRWLSIQESTLKKCLTCGEIITGDYLKICDLKDAEKEIYCLCDNCNKFFNFFGEKNHSRDVEAEKTKFNRYRCSVITVTCKECGYTYTRNGWDRLKHIKSSNELHQKGSKASYLKIREVINLGFVECSRCENQSLKFTYKLTW